LVGVDFGEADWILVHALLVASGDLAEKFDRLGFEFVGYTGTSEALGGDFGREIEPYRQIWLSQFSNAIFTLEIRI